MWPIPHVILYFTKIGVTFKSYGEREGERNPVN